MSKSSVKRVTFGVSDLLFLTFLTLKLTNVVDWSWWVVSAPLWIPAAVVLAVYATAFVIAVLIAIVDEIDD